MREYHKIETVFERSTDGNKYLQLGKFRNPTVEFLKDLPWQFEEKIDGCLCGNTLIECTNGEKITIKEIVDNDLRPEVYGLNKEGEIVPSKVVAVHDNGRTDTWYKISYSRRGNCNKGNYYRTIKCTGNHKIFTQRGYVRADELLLSDQVLLMYDSIDLSFVQKQVLTGLMIGDGSLSKSNSVEFSQKNTHEEYVEYLLRLLGQIAGHRQKNRISGYGTIMAVARTISHYAIKDFCASFYRNGEKIIPDDIELSPISLAVMFMDDGSHTANDNQLSSAMLSLNDYDYPSVQNLKNALWDQLHIKSTVIESKGYSLKFNHKDFQMISTLIAPYVPSCMKYKILEKDRGSLLYTPILEAVPLNVTDWKEIVKIEKITMNKERYDLTTETHNYFASGILVHNCNTRVHWDGHKVSYGGRTDRAQMPVPLMNYLVSVFGTQEVEELFEQTFGEREVILFGEGYGPKIQNGGAYRDDVSFMLFDVLIGDNYQPREMVEKTAKMFGIDVVPIVCEGTIQDGIDFVTSHPKSTMGTAMMEGVVGRPAVELRDRCGNRVIVKIKWKDFKHFAGKEE